MYIKGKGYCGGCYNYIFQLDYARAWNFKKRHNISLETYKKITKKCAICGFNKVVQLHHLDRNHKNNNEENLIGLCPNHHKMIHMFQYKEEIMKLLVKAGVKVPVEVEVKNVMLS